MNECITQITEHRKIDSIQKPKPPVTSKDLKTASTYLADKLSSVGQTIESALDHIYMSSKLKNITKARKPEESSIDHVPIIAEKKKALNMPQLFNSLKKYLV